MIAEGVVGRYQRLEFSLAPVIVPSSLTGTSATVAIKATPGDLELLRANLSQASSSWEVTLGRWLLQVIYDFLYTFAGQANYGGES